MGHIYAFDYYDADEDFSTLGLCGALTPTSCKFTEEANGMSEIEMEHPIDSFGRYLSLVVGNILTVPVPVRTTIDVQMKGVYTLQRMVVKGGVNKKQRVLYKTQKRKGKITTLEEGTYGYAVGHYLPIKKDGSEDTENEVYKLVTEKGTGWMLASVLDEDVEIVIDPNKDETFDERVPDWSVTRQIFRIYKVEKTLGGISVSARHISYDLIGNLCTYESPTEVEEEVTLQDVLDSAMAVKENVVGNGCIAEHDFSFYTDVADTRTNLKYKNVNPIEMLLGEEGLANKYDVGLIRNNYDMYFLKDPGVNRGVRLEYRKNLTGVTFDEDVDEIATRIVPIGKGKKGQDITLLSTYNDNGTSIFANDYPNGWIDSPNITEYPRPYSAPHVYYYEVEDATAEKDNREEFERIQRKLIYETQKMFDDGCDQPNISMSVEFINLGDTEEYKAYRGLENVYVFDYVTVIHPDLRIDVISRIVKTVWDCLLDRMESVEIGQIGDDLANQQISSAQIPSGFSGRKIGSGTIGEIQLGTGCINENHIQANSINTKALASECITTDKISTNGLDASVIKSGYINAERIDTETIRAQVIDGVSEHINNLTATNIKTDTLGAALLRVSSIAATTANIVNAVISNLVLKGEDEKYYSISIDKDGNVSTVEANPTETAVETVSSTVLSGYNVFDGSGLIGGVLGDAVNGGALSSDQAFIAAQVIPAIKTALVQSLQGSVQIEAADSVMFYAGGKEYGMQRWMKFDAANGLEMRKPLIENGEFSGESAWFTRVTDESFDICNAETGGSIDGVRDAVATFKRRGGIMDELRIGNVKIRKTALNGISMSFTRSD